MLAKNTPLSPRLDVGFRLGAEVPLCLSKLQLRGFRALGVEGFYGLGLRVLRGF